MKKLLFGSLVLTTFSFSVILFQISCKKEATAQTSTNNCIGERPTLQFKANGTLYDCNALFDSRVGWYGNTNSSTISNLIEGELPSISKESGASGYTLSGGNQTAYLNFINFSQSILVGTSSVTNGSADCKIPNFSIFTKANCLINITRIGGGTADGTFTGTLINSSNPSLNVTISEGIFKNIMVLQ